MKKSGLHLVRAALCVVACPIALIQSAAAYQASKELPFIHESFDRNPTGAVLPTSSTSTTALGYGIIGNYANLGTWANGGVQIVDGNLTFGQLSTTGGKCLQIDGTLLTGSPAAMNARGVSMTAFMGKPAGDTDFFLYDKLWCSYLVRFVNVSSATDARAELRVVNTASTSVNTFAIHADSTPTTGATASAVQPSVSYQSGTGGGYAYAASPATQVIPDATANTYMMLGKFTNAGNQLTVQTTGTWTAGSAVESIVVASATNISIGQLVTDRDNPASLESNTRVTGISGTTIYISKAPLLDRTSTNLDFNFVAFDTFTSTVRTARFTTGTNVITMTEGSDGTNNVKVGMLVTGTGIQINTKIEAILTSPANSFRVSKNVTTTATSNQLAFRALAGILTTGPVGTTVTIDRMPTEPVNGFSTNKITAGTVLKEIAGKIDAGTYVVSTAGTTLTLNKPLLGSLNTEEVQFFNRVGLATLYTLNEAQFNNYTSGSRTMIESDLNNATIGTGPTQVVARISGIPQATGSWEFQQGRRIDLVAHKQTVKFDELRYGFTLQAVTQPAVFPAAAPNIAQDTLAGFSTTYTDPFDLGSGWKSGYLQLEETAPTKGAVVTSSTAAGSGVIAGSEPSLFVITRTDVSADQGTSRRPDPAFVNMAQPYTVEFDYVPFGSGQREFNAFADRIQIGANGPTGSGYDFSPNPGENIGMTWMVGAVGANDGTNRLFPNAKKWYFFDYDNGISTLVGNPPTPNFFVNEYMVNTGVDVSFNNYRFKIEVDATNYVYHATITEMTRASGAVLKTFSQKNLRFRTRSAAHTVFWGSSKPAGDLRTFMLDNVKVYPGITTFDQYPTWVSAYPGIATGKEIRGEDADGDGKLNFLEFALNGKPNSGADGSLVLRGYTPVREGTPAAPIINYYHTLAIPVRRGVTFPTASSNSMISNKVDGLTYQIQGSLDLADWSQPVVPVLIDTLTTAPTLPAGLNSGWTYKMFRLTTPGPQKGFLRAVVTNQ